MKNKSDDIKLNTKLYIILVNYKQPELTAKCVESIRNSKNITPFVVIVDNCSKDDSISILSKLENDHTILLKSEENNGFAAGNNKGIQYALDNGADFIMFLNNDTEIDPYMIDILLSYCNEQTAVSPKMYYYDEPGKIWFAGGKYLSKTGRFVHIGESELDSDNYKSLTKCDFLTGCCIMLSSETIKKVGFLDESYFMYMEDVDYSIRLKQNNIQLLMVPEAKLWHKVGSSSGGEKSESAIYYGNRNRLYLLNHYHFPLFIRIECFVSRLLLLIKALLKNTNEKVIYYSIKDYINKKTGKRKSVKQKNF